MSKKLYASVISHSESLKIIQQCLCCVWIEKGLTLICSINLPWETATVRCAPSFFSRPICCQCWLVFSPYVTIMIMQACQRGGLLLGSARFLIRRILPTPEIDVKVEHLVVQNPAPRARLLYISYHDSNDTCDLPDAHTWRRYITRTLAYFGFAFYKACVTDTYETPWHVLRRVDIRI